MASEETIEFSSAESPSFPEVAATLIHCAGLSQALVAQAVGRAEAFVESHAGVLRGRNGPGPYDLRYFPKGLFERIATGNWPDLVRVTLTRRLEDEHSMGIHARGIAPVTSLVAQAAYLRYYERERERFDEQGLSVVAWPEVWKFGWAVRNAFAHNAIRWRDTRIASVSWRGVTYSEKDEGRQVMFRDLALGDIVVLMSEMDGALRE